MVAIRAGGVQGSYRVYFMASVDRTEEEFQDILFLILACFKKLGFFVITQKMEERGRVNSVRIKAKPANIRFGKLLNLIISQWRKGQIIVLNCSEIRGNVLSIPKKLLISPELVYFEVGDNFFLFSEGVWGKLVRQINPCLRGVKRRRQVRELFGKSSAATVKKGGRIKIPSSFILLKISLPIFPLPYSLSPNGFSYRV